MPDLDERLTDGRAALLADIAQPPLERIGTRAAAIRHRRRAARAGAAGALALIAWFFVVRPQPAPAPEVAAPPPAAPVYAGNGITINGLPDLSQAYDLPGAVVDIEFADPRHGFAVSACRSGDAAGCRPALATTADGGRRWGRTGFPPGVDRREVPELEVFDHLRVLITVGALTYSSADGGLTWQERVAGDRPAPMGAGDLLRPGRPGAGCAGGRVDVWSPGLGLRGPLATQPDLDVCQVVPAGAGGRAWWAGGTSDTRAAVAVTRDGGRSWRSQPLPATGSARVAALGGHVYALVTDAGGRLSAVFHSADRGATFRLTGSTGLPPGLAGDPVPLLDGRLLLVDPAGHWWVSADDGRTFRQAGGTLPVAGRVARTTAGFVAHDLFHAGWAAFSTDGSTWRKLDLY